MRYPASEKLELIRLVEQSYLPIKQTLDKLEIPRTTFYRGYDRYQGGGPEALEDQSRRSTRLLIITIITDTTRASTTSHPQTFTLGVDKPF